VSAAGERPRRVLVVARWYPAVDDRGAGVFVADHCAALVAAGVDVRVASFENAPLFDGDDATERRLATRWADAAAARPPVASPVSWGAPEIPVARLRVVTRPRVGDGLDEIRRVEPEATALLAFGRALAADWPFDLIHAHTGLPDGAAAAVLASDLGIPLVTTEHDHAAADRLGDAGARAAYGRLLDDGRTLVAVSAHLAARLATALGIATDRIAVVPNPVAIDEFTLADPAARDPDELLFVGRLRASKGIAALLEGLAIARRARPLLHLRLLGGASDAELAEWRGVAAALGVADAVVFEAPGGRSTVVAAMQRAGAFVHPSRLETFGIVAAEALATGLPVVATPSGGVDEILGRDGRLGEVTAGFEAADIAAAIDRLLERRAAFDPADLRSVVVERYAPAAVGARTIELHDQALAGRPARSSAPAASRPRVDSLPGSTVVVGFRRAALDRQLAPLAAALREQLRVVTTGRPGPTEDESAATWTLVAADTGPADGAGPAPRSGIGRILWLIRHPLAAARRRLRARERPAQVLDRRRAAVREFVAAAPGPLLLLPLDADDLLAVEPVLDARITLAGGGLRWLADAWDEAHPEIAPPRTDDD
jgi:glycosyltransferase involved in cell wall biosynthesis